MNGPLFTCLEQVLAPLATADAGGELDVGAVTERALRNDAELIRLLLGESRLRRAFFRAVAGALIFERDKFLRFLNTRSFLPDSFTSFKNKIGLTAGEVELASSREVVLVWPYKDCVLEGGQAREAEARREIFWNEILAPEQIDVLFAPKAFTNFKRFDAKGAHSVAPGELDLSKANLIIKGNNLLALHSLQKRFSGLVKLIYIDPPYNTGNDGFRYNDRFTHSSWLTFMKNRIEAAIPLLCEDGLMWISVNDVEAHYLKVLADELFRRENFIADVIWNSTKSVTNTALISDAHTHTLVYARNIAALKENRTSFRLPADASKFANPDNDPRGKWVADPFQVGGVRKNQLYPITNPKTGKVYRPNPGCSWKNEKKVFEQLLRDNRIVFGVSGESGPQRKRFWSEAAARGRVVTTLWKDLPTTTQGTQHLKKLFGRKVFDNPKPEALLQRIIELSTAEGDLVLDYHLGSGTTAAVAHKMRRRYIGIEQMNYIREVAVARLQMVIAGEAGGISKSVSWQGGGEFIYCELASLNAAHAERIAGAASHEALIAVWQDMKQHAILDYRLQEQAFEERLSEFASLPLAKQKQCLIEMLDKNMLYVNYSEIDDRDYALDETTRALNRLFYA